MIGTFLLLTQITNDYRGVNPYMVKTIPRYKVMKDCNNDKIFVRAGFIVRVSLFFSDIF